MATVYDLEQAINERHSTRMFLPRPVRQALASPTTKAICSRTRQGKVLKNAASGSTRAAIFR
jgi:hypothetical protein